MKSNASRSSNQNKPQPANLTPAEQRHALVGPPDLWESKREFQIEFLTQFGLKPHHHLLDLGCGTLRGGIPLISYLKAAHYFGIDIHDEVLREAGKELEEAGLKSKSPTLLLVPDISRVRLPQKFDFIWAFSVLIHMPDEVLDPTLRFVAQHLSENGIFYANVRYGKKKDGRWKWAHAVWRSLDFYKAACARHGLNVSDMGPLKEYGHLSHRADWECQRMLQICAPSRVRFSDPDFPSPPGSAVLAQRDQR